MDRLIIYLLIIANPMADCLYGEGIGYDYISFTYQIKYLNLLPFTYRVIDLDAKVNDSVLTKANYF